MTVIERTPGHNLYREWIDAPGTDAAEKGWHPQNPAVKERWEKLAARVMFKVADDALNHLGSATEPIEVVRVEQLAEIIEEAAERIFASGILDEIAASDDGFGRDAMQDAVTIARLAYRGR
jgi:hypothetical protein